MSFANFDEIYDICFGMMEEEEALMNKRPAMGRLDFTKDRIPDTIRWWEEAAREDVKERELVHV